MTNIKVGKKYQSSNTVFNLPKPSNLMELLTQSPVTFAHLFLEKGNICSANKKERQQPHETFLSILVNHGGILWVNIIIYLFFLKHLPFFFFLNLPFRSTPETAVEETFPLNGFEKSSRSEARKLLRPGTADLECLGFTKIFSYQKTNWLTNFGVYTTHPYSDFFIIFSGLWFQIYLYFHPKP